MTAALPGDLQNQTAFRLNLVTCLEILTGESPSLSRRVQRRTLRLCTVARADDFIITHSTCCCKAPAPESVWKEKISAFSSVSGNKPNNKKHSVIFFSLALSPT